ncbi:hypothetical protein [Polyangium sp. 6x1]|uniref:hypothetical protein n=1 Tax=Polyangium sp. 6x1 TaxID=3042689 RepID=UPI0024831CDD|nr:hypothetical protein [Polyangium sp. 6x1]MDI1444210.1 hypothetical protein [Polyangium sp. 6x1]
MKNPLGRLFSALAGGSFAAPTATDQPPTSPSPPSVEVQRAEEDVRAREAVAREAAAREAEALAALAAPRKASEDAARALEAAEDAAAEAPDDEATAERLVAAQRAVGLASGVLRSAQRRHAATQAETAKANAAMHAARVRLDAARADVARAEADAWLQGTAREADAARRALVADHPAAQIAAELPRMRDGVSAARAVLGSLVTDVLGALQAGEDADRRALAADPGRRADIEAAAEARRTMARETLEAAADVETWNALLAGPLAMFELCGELAREAEAEIRLLADEAHGAGIEARKLGSSYEPIAPKLVDAAIIFGRFLGNDPKTREKTDITATMKAVLEGVPVFSGYGRQGVMSYEEVGRLILRDPRGRLTHVETEFHRRLVERGERGALENEEKEGRGTDPRLVAMREASARRTAEWRDEHEKRAHS